VLAVSRSYFGRITAHHLALSVERAAPLPLGLLQVPETLGGANWQPARTDFGDILERDDFSLNRHPALIFLLEHGLFRKPVTTFRDHALAGMMTEIPEAVREGAGIATVLRKSGELADLEVIAQS
jgi:hypothetical protein